MLLFLNAITRNNADFTEEAVRNHNFFKVFNLKLKYNNINDSFLNYNEQRLPENIPRS